MRAERARPEPSSSSNDGQSGVRIRKSLDARKERAHQRFGAIQHEVDSLQVADLHPTVLGLGGEHLVFEVSKKDQPEELRDTVVKINFWQTAPYLQAEMNGDHMKMDEEMEKIRSEIDRRREQFKELRHYFGYGSVPVQRMMVADIPVTPALVKKFAPSLRDAERPFPETVPAWVSVQRRLGLPKNEEGETYVSLTGYYPEKTYFKRGVDPDEARRRYDLAHDVLVGKQVEATPREIKQSILELYPDLMPVAKLLKDEKTFSEADREFTLRLRETVKALIAYSRETLISLDLAGKNNIIMTKEGDAWKLKILDPFTPTEAGATVSFTSLQQVIDDVQQRVVEGDEEALTHGDARRSLNQLNTLRVINALAYLSGIEDRLELEGLKQISAETWRIGLSSRFLS